MKIKEAIDKLQEVLNAHGNVELLVDNMLKSGSVNETRELYIIGKINEKTLKKEEVTGVYFINYVEEVLKNNSK